MALLFGTLNRCHGYRRLYFAATVAMILGSLVMSVASNVLAVLVAALLRSFAIAIITPVAF